MTTQAECVQLAEAAGFNPARAVQACSVTFGESGNGADQRCACARTDGGTIWHDAECDSPPDGGSPLTKHCGVLQLDVSNPAFQAVLSSGCGFDLACSLRALFDLSRGGACFDQPNPWGPHFGQPYGGCMGQVTPATLASAPPGSATLLGAGADCHQCGVTNPAACVKCAIASTPGPFGVGGAGSGLTNPLGALDQLAQLVKALFNPNTWLRAGLVIAGIVAMEIGLSALTRAEPGGKQDITLKLPESPSPAAGGRKIARTWRDVRDPGA